MFGVVRGIPGNMDPAHTDQQMYSCGSLAPKMRRGGCMDSHFHKPASPGRRVRGEGVCGVGGEGVCGVRGN